MIAILSDIQGNLEALTAVLEDTKNQRVGGIYNLADWIGYERLAPKGSMRDDVKDAMRIARA
jgi:hypothetical protein